MAEANPTKRVRSFVARELQLSIAVFAVIALLGGILLQAFSSGVVRYFGLGPASLVFFLVVGYVFLVIVLSLIFSHRLVGPFKRIEYEMKLVSTGELSRRISVRSSDDLHVKHFVDNVNRFIGKFEDLSREYNRLNSVLSERLDRLADEVSSKEIDCEKVKKEIAELKLKVHELREKW